MASYQKASSVNVPLAREQQQQQQQQRKSKNDVWMMGGLLLVGLLLASLTGGFNNNKSDDEAFVSISSSSTTSSSSLFSWLGRGHPSKPSHVVSSKSKNTDFHPLQLTGYPDLATQKQFLKDLEKIDWDEVKADIVDVMTNSQPWWPADYGTYGGLFTRLSWHTCGSYRASDGRGGCDGGGQR
jgi:hypothetical protein